jgi:hypothetical protein
MKVTTVRFPQSLYDDLAAEAGARNLSVSEYIRVIVRQREHTQANTPANTQANTDVAELAERVAALEERLDGEVTGELPHVSESRPDSWGNSGGEGAPTESARAAADGAADSAGGDTGENGAAGAPGQRGDEPGGAVESALSGWRHGRDETERQASRAIAEQAIAWLRETPLDDVSRSDVPLEEFAGDDPLGRTAETLWTEVVRDAYQHAAGQGYVEQPHSRAYRWVGRDG